VRLAEIVEEGEKLEAACREQVYLTEQIAAGDAIARFHNLHGRTLLAVAKAAVEMREASEVAASDLSDAAVDRFIAARAAFDAAVRGEGEETT